MQLHSVLFLCFLIIASTKFSSGDGYSPKPKFLCRGEEREALFSFRDGIVDPSTSLPSWRGEECCSWEGIICHNITGHVLKLHLGGSFLSGDINNSLAKLIHLQYLDLSQNDFGSILIPEFIGSLHNLRYLNLSNSGFVGPIPYQLINLTNLHYLDLRSGVDALSIKDLESISSITTLKFLDLSEVNLSKASNQLQVLNKLHSLSVLHLSLCELHDIPDSLPRFNFSSLFALDLSGNDIISLKFDWLSDLSSLVVLDLSSNKFHGPIPRGIGNMTSLKFLDLSVNRFSSHIPLWLYHMSAIETLDLAVNKFQGQLPSGIENLTSLTHLDLYSNALEGEILPSLASLCSFQLLNSSYTKPGKSLEFLSLSWNKFSGHLPDQLGQCKSLFFLSIGGNSFHGPLPLSIMGGLSSLSFLGISANSLEGTVVTEKYFANLTKLEVLLANTNKLALQVSSNWTPPFQLKTLSLGSWHLGPQFPAWLQTQKDLTSLNIAETGISDSIPDWFWSMFSLIQPSILLLDLSHNQLKGNIEKLPFGGYIDLGSNRLTGSPPQLSSNAVEVDLSNNLFSGSLSPMLCRRIGGENLLTELDLSGNLLSEEIPDCWWNWKGLAVLNLGENEFTGPVPISMGSLQYLSSLQLHNNYLSGMLPTLENCTSLLHMDLSGNRFSGSVPMWIGNNLTSLVVLALHSNNFSGNIALQLCHIHSLQILDLGNNGLSGNIPACFGNFTAMIKQPNATYPFSYRMASMPELSSPFTPKTWLVVKRIRNEYKSTLGLLTGIDLSSNKLSGEIPEEFTALHSLIFLNLSGNHLVGRIPMEIRSMKALESLDLSMNNLSGAIPQSISSISFLSYLNFSFNNLSGKIPTGTQIQGFSPLSFIGNHGLYGPPLTRTDEKDGAEDPTQDHADEDDKDESEWIDMKWFYVSMPLGFAVGFWAFWGPLVFNRAWRYAYFKFVDDVIIYNFL